MSRGAAAWTVLLIASVLVAPPSLPQSPYFRAVATWGSPSSPLLVAPGSSNVPLTIQLIYEGPVNLYNVTASLELGYPLAPAWGQGNVTAYAPILEPGGELVLSGFFNVSGSAHVGVYNGTVRVSYVEVVQGPLGEEVPLAGSEEINFSLPVIGYSGVRIVGFYTSPPVIYAGDSAGELTVVLVNYGNAPAEDVNVTASFSPPLSPLYPGSNSAFIAYMPPGEPVNLTFPFSVSGAPYGSATISSAEINVSCSSCSAELSVPLEIAPSAHFEASGVAHGAMAPGSSDSYVTITLVNSGGAEAKYLTATLLTGPAFSPYAPSSENPIIAAESVNYTLGDVMPGGSVNVTYVVDVASGLRPGTYYLPLLLTWYQPPTMQPMHQVIEVPITVTSPFSLPSLASLTSGEGRGLVPYAAAIAVIAVLLAMVLVGRKS